MPELRRPQQLPLFPEPSHVRARPDRVAPMPPVDACTSLAAAAVTFGERLALDGKTENTRLAFMSDLRLLGRWLGSDCAVGAVTTDELRRFLSWMAEYRGKPCSDKTYARRVTTLKVFFAWLAESGALPRDPALALVHRRAQAPLPMVLSDGQVAALLATAHDREKEGDPRPALLVRLLLDTGLKKGEIVRLRLDDVDTASETPTLLVRYDSPRWKPKERRVAFSVSAARLLAAYRRRYAPSERLFECTARNLEYVLTDLVRAAGLPERTSFETLRWTCALRCHRARTKPDDLRQKLGLSPVTWTDTERKLGLLAGEAGRQRVSPFFPQPHPK